MLCYAMLCYVMMCYAMLCYVVPYVPVVPAQMQPTGGPKTKKPKNQLRHGNPNSPASQIFGKRCWFFGFLVFLALLASLSPSHWSLPRCSPPETKKPKNQLRPGNPNSPASPIVRNRCWFFGFLVFWFLRPVASPTCIIPVLLLFGHLIDTCWHYPILPCM